MSLTAVVWVCTAAGLTICSFFRATYGLSLYMFTFFVFPALWWWGRPLPNLRWNLFAGIVLLFAVLTKRGRAEVSGQPDPRLKHISNIAIAIAVNATLVHLLFSPSLEISVMNYTRLLKFVLLFFMIIAAVRNPKDFRLALWSIVLGAAYIGYEVTFNDRGRFIGGRLEDVGAAGVENANALASLTATVLPLAGGLFFWGTRREKLLIAICGPLILNVVLLCSSRGALLALICGAGSFVVTSSGAVRKKSLQGLALAGLATFLLLGDPEIVARFATTFSGAEERDDSAASRLVFWVAGLRMVADHPFGAGGDGYKLANSSDYLSGLGIEVGARSVHSGILNEACEWGVQGWILRMLFIGFAVQLTRRTLRRQSGSGAGGEAALGCALVASAVTFFVTCAFGDYMDDEWGYWIPALMIVYGRLYGSVVRVEEAATPVSGRLRAPAGGLRRPVSPVSARVPCALSTNRL
jgi:O-antigen ligase